jgi:hypothetical protein
MTDTLQRFGNDMANGGGIAAHIKSHLLPEEMRFYVSYNQTVPMLFLCSPGLLKLAAVVLYL